ncbi:MAG: GNAT family N-acetyltransferase [Mariniphaga sp.]|nr:GNAT family N-acetyltransferase [Mariniphaga sp.]
MRKANQEISDKAIIEEILQSSKICRIGISDKGLPYVLPFNYGYSDNQIYIHCALTGKKIDLLRENPNVCFDIEQTAGIVKNDKACKWATTYRSIVGYGKIEILADFAQKQKGLEIIMAHNGAPELIEFEPKQVESVLILKLSIDSLTGKQSSNWDKLYNDKTNHVESERLILSEISLTDLDNIHNLHSIPEVDEYNTLGIPKTIEETKNLIKPIIQNRFKTPRDSYTWKICLKDSNQFIGLAGFTLSNDKFKLGEIYYILHPDYWGNGYATEIAKQLVKKGFDDFDLQKVEAGVATENIKSIRVLEKIGMTREGLRRKILPIRGEWKDNYHYAIVRTDERDY